MLAWREVGLDGARAESLVHRRGTVPGVIVVGSRGADAYVALVASPDDVTRVPGAGAAPVWSATEPEFEVEYTCGSPPAWEPDSERVEEFLVTDSPDDTVVRAWVTCGDEDSCMLTWGRSGRLFAYEPGYEDPWPGPSLAPADVDALLVAGAEIGLTVAGRLSDGSDDDGARPHAWRYFGQKWTRLDLLDPPDAFTDGYTANEPVLTGHRAGMPVLFGHTGGSLPAPPAELDPRHPQVSVAHVEGAIYGSDVPGWDGRMHLAVQGREGIQLWLQHGAGWTMLPGPVGTLQAARFSPDGAAAWCVADHRLWHADLGAVRDALGIG